MKNIVTNLLTSDLVRRAVWTFLQAFVAVWLVSEESAFDTAALVGAVGAGLSAVKTLLVGKFLVK